MTEDITMPLRLIERLRDKGYSTETPIELWPVMNTDYKGQAISDWSLEYWTMQFLPESLISYLKLEDLRRFAEDLYFYPLERHVKTVIEKIRHTFKIRKEISKIIRDPEDGESILWFEIYVDEDDIKKVVKIWKEISESIRNEIDKEFKDKSEKYQLKLHISVRPFKALKNHVQS